MKSITILVDTNIALDYLDQRELFRENAGVVLKENAHSASGG